MKKRISILLVLAYVSLTQAQNVGIGTSTPISKLDVNGTFRLTDGTQGDGKILTSDSTGLASWQSPPPPPPPPSYYPSVTICCQSWMTRNLDVSVYRNGDPIPHVTDNVEWEALTTGAYCYYNNDSATYAATYGKLYNWFALDDPRGLAPEGWHIPSDIEWITLSDCLGGEFVAGGPLKEMGTAHWFPPNEGATDITNFTALPGGFRSTPPSNHNFLFITANGLWWSSTMHGSNAAGYITLYYELEWFDNTSGALMNSGISIRCIRD